mgnify:CR=1 FL=1
MVPLIAAGAVAVIAIIGGGAWFVLRPAPVATIAPSPPAFVVRTAGEAEIARHEAAQLTIFRVADNPSILVLDYPTLRQQGQALNRVAALIEKADQPRDRVLHDEALAHAVEKSGETVESYYFGHDYGSADLVRFFALADRDGIKLGPDEEALRTLLRQEGMLDGSKRGALISIPRVGTDSVDAFTRRIILRHELAHGEFFANPAYAAFCHRAWNDVLTAKDRAAFTKFLNGLGYEPSNHDLLVNEMQAFLMFTLDPRYINAALLGLPEAAFAGLRARFLAAMPDGWLKTLAGAPLP